jgi:copper chaperone CopZ
MTDFPASSLADEIEKALRAVDGVTEVYASAPLSAVVVSEVGAAVLPVAGAPLVTVETGKEGTNVVAVIGVDESGPAHETGRAAHDRIVDVLEGRLSAAHVTVRIAMISS